MINNKIILQKGVIESAWELLYGLNRGQKNLEFQLAHLSLFFFNLVDRGCLPFTRKSRNFGWNVNEKINFVSPNEIFFRKTGFLER